MADWDFNLEEVAHLMRLVESQNLSELIVEQDGLRVVIRGRSYAEVRPSALLTAPTEESAAHSAWLNRREEEAAEEEAALDTASQQKRIAVSSPMIGVFYRSSGPDTAPYIEVGDRVEVGQVIGLLEAM